MASTSAESVRRFSEKPKICRKKNVPTSDTGTAMAGMSVLRKSVQEDIYDDEDEEEGLEERLDDVPDRGVEEVP